MYVRMLPASAIALVLGCAGQAASPEVPADHPASPNAVVAPVPQRSATLAIDSDQRMAPPSTTSATRGGHHADDGTAPQLPNDASTHSGHDHHAAEPSNTAATRPAAGATVYSCPHHPEVTSDKPDQRCPKCNMKLVPKK